MQYNGCQLVYQKWATMEFTQNFYISSVRKSRKSERSFKKEIQSD